MQSFSKLTSPLGSMASLSPYTEISSWPYQITMGRLTFAEVDDDKWYWAIVLDFKDCQDFDMILCGFEGQAIPSDRVVKAMMEGLIARYPQMG